MFNRLLLIISVLMLCSCTTVPVSTMLKLSTFDDDDFSSLIAEDVQAIVTISNNAPLNPDHVKLDISIGKDQEKQSFLFPVELVSKSAVAAKKGWFDDSPAATKYRLRLTEDGLSNLKQLQAMRNKRDQAYRINVFLSFLALPKDYNEVILSVAIQLDKDEKPVVLFSEATLAQAVTESD